MPTYLVSSDTILHAKDAVAAAQEAHKRSLTDHWNGIYVVQSQDGSGENTVVDLVDHLMADQDVLELLKALAELSLFQGYLISILDEEANYCEFWTLGCGLTGPGDFDGAYVWDPRWKAVETFLQSYEIEPRLDPKANDPSTSNLPFTLRQACQIVYDLACQNVLQDDEVLDDELAEEQARQNAALDFFCKALQMEGNDDTEPSEDTPHLYLNSDGLTCYWQDVGSRSFGLVWMLRTNGWCAHPADWATGGAPDGEVIWQTGSVSFPTEDDFRGAAAKFSELM